MATNNITGIYDRILSDANDVEKILRDIKARAKTMKKAYDKANKVSNGTINVTPSDSTINSTIGDIDLIVDIMRDAVSFLQDCQNGNIEEPSAIENSYEYTEDNSINFEDIGNEENKYDEPEVSVEGV